MIATMNFGSPSKDFVQIGAPFNTFLHLLLHILINNSSGSFDFLIVLSGKGEREREREGDVQFMLWNVCEFQLKRCHFADGSFHFAIVFYILTTFTTFTASFLLRRFNKMKTHAFVHGCAMQFCR